LTKSIDFDIEVNIGGIKEMISFSAEWDWSMDQTVDISKSDKLAKDVSKS